MMHNLIEGRFKLLQIKMKIMLKLILIPQFRIVFTIDLIQIKVLMRKISLKIMIM